MLLGQFIHQACRDPIGVTGAPEPLLIEIVMLTQRPADGAKHLMVSIRDRIRYMRKESVIIQISTRW